MQPVRGGRLGDEVLLDVLEVLRVPERRRRLERREELERLEQLLAQEGVQVRRAQPPVLVVGDVPAVHDLAKDVAQVVPRHLCGATVERLGRGRGGCGGRKGTVVPGRSGAGAHGGLGSDA